MATQSTEYGRAEAWPVVVGRLEEVRYRVRTEVVYDLHWPHEGSGGVLAGDFGTPVEPGIEAEIDVRLRGRFACELTEGEGGRPRLTVRDEGRNRRAAAPEAAVRGDAHVGALRPPVERAIAARMALAAGRPAPVADCTFDFSDEGVRRYQRARAGDLGCVTGGARTPIEIHLPFLGRREWPRREELLRSIEWDVTAMGRVRGRVAGDDGVTGDAALLLATSIWLYRTGGPSLATLAHERRWDGSAASAWARAPLFEAYGLRGRIEGPATLSLSLGGDAAAAWTRTAPEDSVEFFRQFARVSLAVQRTLRQWLPAVYLAEGTRLADPELALPMLVYRHARPYAGKYRGEYALDPMSRETLEAAFRSARPMLKPALDAVETALAGDDAAARYSVANRRKLLDGLERCPRRLRGLLAAELALIDLLIAFGVECRHWGERLGDPWFEPKLVRRAAARFAKVLRYRLRRVYGNADYTHLAPLLLLEATAALSEGDRGAIRAVAAGEDGVWQF